jgi:peptidoglycan/LPS O-acetylase OafA/YrhL
MRLKYEPSLDGVRALSALSVLFFHAHVPGFARGGNGVTVFFVLSGYLITTILAADASDGAIDLRRFWSRRIRRLLPALLAVVAVTLAITPLLLPDEAPRMGAAALLAITYTMNIANSLGFPMTALSHTWTLGLEMQFYLLWPFVVGWLGRLRRPDIALFAAWGLIAVIVGSLSGLPTNFVIYSPVYRIDALILGAALAYTRPVSAPLGWLGAGLILLGTFPPPHGLPAIAERLPLVEMGAGLLISSLRRPSVLSRSLGWAPLAWLGAISYGIYLWHFPILEVLRGWNWVVRAAIATPLAIGLARLSYITIERWGRTVGLEIHAADNQAT